MCKSPEYLAWANVIKRCYNPNHDAYHNYGGRGIVMCDEWRHDFVAFYKHIGPRPKRGYDLDRIDNNRGYEPGNVRWVTRRVNANNRRVNVLVEYNGESITIADLARESGVDQTLLRERIGRGWPITEAVNIPAGAVWCRDNATRERRQTKVWVDLPAGRVSFSAACRKHGVAIDTAWRRFRLYGWPILQAVGAEPRTK